MEYHSHQKERIIETCVSNHIMENQTYLLLAALFVIVFLCLIVFFAIKKGSMTTSQFFYSLIVLLFFLLVLLIGAKIDYSDKEKRPVQVAPSLLMHGAKLARILLDGGVISPAEFRTVTSLGPSLATNGPRLGFTRKDVERLLSSTNYGVCLRDTSARHIRTKPIPPPAEREQEDISNPATLAWNQSSHGSYTIK
jgi:hypothetical protein